MLPSQQRPDPLPTDQPTLLHTRGTPRDLCVMRMTTACALSGWLDAQVPTPRPNPCLHADGTAIPDFPGSPLVAPCSKPLILHQSLASWRDLGVRNLSCCKIGQLRLTVQSHTNQPLKVSADCSYIGVLSCSDTISTSAFRR